MTMGRRGGGSAGGERGTARETAAGPRRRGRGGEVRRRPPARPRRDDDGEREGPHEIAFVGDLTDNEADLTDKLLAVPSGGECTIWFDSPGGNPYAAMALATLMRLRGLRATGIVGGECSSAALWPFATCTRRLVTPFSVFLFHPMKWQSEEHIGITEAAEWSRHFVELEADMDRMLCDLFGRAHDLIALWIKTHRYVSGREMVEAGLAEMVGLEPLPDPVRPAE
ncbi:MAG: ATP-dependent Clp protease proteolytic subunit [Planctomycetaceae bacterium]